MINKHGSETLRTESRDAEIESIDGFQTLEHIREQILHESDDVVENFKTNTATELEKARDIIERGGSSISESDINELLVIESDVDVARETLQSELDISNKIKISSGEAREVATFEQYNENAPLIQSGQQRLHEMAKAGETSSPIYSALFNILLKQEGTQMVWKNSNEIDVQELSESIKNTLTKEVPPPLPVSESIPDPEDDEPFVSKMKERVIETPEQLDARRASKEFLQVERKMLAEEIRVIRKAQRERLERLQIASEIAEYGEVTTEDDAEYAYIAEAQGAEAVVVAERLLSEELNAEDEQDERETINQLIGTSKSMEVLKKKLEAHYAKADVVAQEKFESVKKSVEQVLLRNDAFIVHTFLLTEELRHNDNSNISHRAKVEDDIDILLSLEPSISTSSVKPGSKHGLWQDGIGVVLGGGDIQGVRQSDDGTITEGIKSRSGKVSSSAEIDENVSDTASRGYNELVVNNPKVFGFFKNVGLNDLGEMRGFKTSIDDKKSKKLIQKNNFLKYINYGKDRGMPALIMTPDRRLFEFVSINDEGIVTVGAEISPEQVATGKAGLPENERKEIGKMIVEKNLFRNTKDQHEAKQIVANLAGEKVEQKLSKDEYLAYVRDNNGFGKIDNFPKELLADREFMMEASQYSPDTAYQYASDELQHDVDYIKHIFECRKSLDMKFGMYTQLPEEMKKEETFALMALDYDDYDSLDISFSDSPRVWGRIIDKLVDKKKS